MTKHERPGVYSAYDASAVVWSGRTGGTAGVAAQAPDKPGVLSKLDRYEEAVALYGEDAELTRLIGLLFANGASRVFAVPVAGTEGYQGAFDLLGSTEGISVTVCGSTDEKVQEALRESVKTASAGRRERIAVVSAGAAGVDALVTRAETLNDERMVLVGPAVKGGAGTELAAAVAGAICAEQDPAVPLGGAVLKGVGDLTARYGEAEIDTLIRGGVVPVEESGGLVTVVRGVTTRTKSGGATDPTWRELTTIRIVDHVIPGIRNALRSKFRRAKNTAQSRGAIRSQVVLELEHQLEREIITGYEGVSVTADPENPTVCRVEFSFTVAHGLNQIWLSAHITV